MVNCKITASQVRQQWRYCSLALSHWYVLTHFICVIIWRMIYKTRVRDNYMIKFFYIDYWYIEFSAFYCCVPIHRKLIMAQACWFWSLVISRWIRILTILDNNCLQLVLIHDNAMKASELLAFLEGNTQVTSPKSPVKGTEMCFLQLAWASSWTSGRVAAALRRHDLWNSTVMFCVELNWTIHVIYTFIA